VNEALLPDLAAAGCETRVLNVRDPAAITATFAAVGTPDVLFNCAGFVANGTILDCDEEAWAFSLDLNVTAMYRMCKAVLPGMVERGHGNIVNMASRRGVDHRGAEPLRLWGDQGGGDRADQGHCGGFRDQGHPLQLHLPRHGGKPQPERPDPGPMC
jgi:NAD(P)-dependent dehydrogenase (short-subunit alcohol dehydrogenase family)